MARTVIENLPSGVTIAYGGTRTSIKVDRPWQVDIKIDPTTCPFEDKEEANLAYHPQDGGWRVLDNRYTPFEHHRLIIPEACWTAEQLRILGGEEKIAAVLTVVNDLMTSEPTGFWLGVHVGPLAGQNVGHLHYHLLVPLSPLSRSTENDVVAYAQSRNPSLVICEAEDFKVVAGGCKAGQCFIVPKCEIELSAQTTSLAKLLNYIITLYNDKFRSLQGLTPDFAIGIEFSRGKMRYGCYTPVLTNWGFTEYFGLIEGSPLILPWPHEESARYLRK